MTRKPHRFEWWLHYHLSLGICHFFIHGAPRTDAPKSAPPAPIDAIDPSLHLPAFPCPPAPCGHSAVEDTPELLPLLASPEFAPFVTVTHVSEHNPQQNSQNGNYYTLMERQEAQVLRSLDECPRHGIDWLSS